MARFESVSELYDAVEWEGGIVDAIFSYGGIRAKDLPKGTPLDIVLIWEKLEGMEEDVRQVQLWLECNAEGDE